MIDRMIVIRASLDEKRNGICRNAEHNHREQSSGDGCSQWNARVPGQREQHLPTGVAALEHEAVRNASVRHSDHVTHGFLQAPRALRALLLVCLFLSWSPVRGRCAAVAGDCPSLNRVSMNRNR